jgi:2-dehydro-3-deoxyphosphogluconate aldolase/(4S)-4-hydroxy-2-oxoglutarate aldolase
MAAAQTAAAQTALGALEAALDHSPIVGIVRTDRPGAAVGVARALIAGGIRAVEVALTTPDALEAIAALSADPGGAVVGAGSVRTVEEARAALAAGARFFVTPATYPDVLAFAAEQGVPVVCGALTPTELDAAQRAGASFVKVFPAGELGPSYLSSVRAPMPELRLVPTGGVTLENVGEWFRHGARAVAVGSALVPEGALVAGDGRAIRERAAAFVSAVRAARP